MSVPIDRKAEVVKRCIRRELSVTKAAALLGVSRRQLSRWKNRYLEEGIAGLRSRKIGRTAANRTPTEVRTKAVSLLSTVYADFGPKFAAEKLAERDGISLSRESVRQIMVSEGIWTDRASKPVPAIHQLREPMERRGELVQIDGSEHRWFEGRGPKCALLLFIDDATSEIGHLHFTLSEMPYSTNLVIGRWRLSRASEYTSVFGRGRVQGSCLTTLKTFSLERQELTVRRPTSSWNTPHPIWRRPKMRSMMRTPISYKP